MAIFDNKKLCFERKGGSLNLTLVGDGKVGKSDIIIVYGKIPLRKDDLKSRRSLFNSDLIISELKDDYENVKKITDAYITGGSELEKYFSDSITSELNKYDYKNEEKINNHFLSRGLEFENNFDSACECNIPSLEEQLCNMNVHEKEVHEFRNGFDYKLNLFLSKPQKFLMKDVIRHQQEQQKISKHPTKQKTPNKFKSRNGSHCTGRQNYNFH